MVVRFPSVDTSSCLSGLSSLSWLICRRPVGVAVMGQASKQLTFRFSYRRNHCDVRRSAASSHDLPRRAALSRSFNRQTCVTTCWRCPYEPIIGVKSMFWPPRDTSINLQVEVPRLIGKCTVKIRSMPLKWGRAGWMKQSHGKQPLRRLSRN